MINFMLFIVLDTNVLILCSFVQKVCPKTKVDVFSRIGGKHNVPINVIR